MSETNQATSGAVDETSGSSDTVVDGKYPESFVNKIKKEKENLAKSIIALKAEKDEALSLLKKKNDEDLEKTAQYKTLWENSEKSKTELAAVLKAKEDQIKQGKMASSVRGELLKLGLAPEHLDTAFKLMDWKLVTTDPETDSVIGSDAAAKVFYDQHNSLGFFKKQAPGVNHNAPSGKAMESGFAAEAKAAKSQRELDVVLKKYNMA